MNDSESNVEPGIDAADDHFLPDQDQDQDHGNPRKRKRTRVTKACELCRKRKEKCDGARPACGSCVTLHRFCSYAAKSRRRGLPTGFIHSREVLLGLLLQLFDGAEERILQALQALQADRPCYDRLAKEQYPRRICASLLGVWRSSRAATELEKVLEDAESREDDHSLPTPNFDAKLTALHNACVTDLSTESVTIPPDYGIITPAATSSLVNEPDDTPYDDLSDAPVLTRKTVSASAVTYRSGISAPPIASAVPLLPESWLRLVELYMANTHCWLPALEPHSLFRSSALISQHMPGVGQDHLSEGQMASFWSVLSYASHQIHRTTPTDFPSQDMDRTQLQPIHAYSRQLALKDYVKYDLGHVHTFLLVALSHMGRCEWTSAWLWIGKAVYVAIDLGINVSQKQQSVSEGRPDDPGKRAFVSCFLFDTLVASRLGRRPHLRSDDLNQFAKFRTESLEEWDSWRPYGQNTHGSVVRTSQGPARILSIWNNLLYVIRLLNQSICTSADNPSCVSKEALTLLDQLVAWQSGLPPQMRIIGNHGFTPFTDTPHSVNLTLAIIAVYLMLLASVKSDVSSHTATVKVRFPKQGWAQIVEFLKSLPNLDNHFRPGWMPPIFGIYLESLDKSRRVLCPELPGWEDATTCVLDSIRTVWVRPAPEAPITAWEANFIPHTTRPLQTGPNDISLTIDGFQSGSYATPCIEMESRLSSLPKERGTESTAAKMVTPNANAEYRRKESLLHATGLEEEQGASQSLSTDHDMLFNTLSSLDSVEWSSYNQEFIENLGFHGDTTLYDLQF